MVPLISSKISHTFKKKPPPYFHKETSRALNEIIL